MVEKVLLPLVFKYPSLLKYLIFPVSRRPCGMKKKYKLFPAEPQSMKIDDDPPLFLMFSGENTMDMNFVVTF